VLVKVSAAVGADLGLADVAMHSCICSVTGVCTLADKAIHSYICSVTSVCIYSVYKHVAPTFSDRHQSTIDLLFCSTLAREAKQQGPCQDSQTRQFYYFFSRTRQGEPSRLPYLLMHISGQKLNLRVRPHARGGHNILYGPF
jgi:hypothetical protein